MKFAILYQIGIDLHHDFQPDSIQYLLLLLSAPGFPKRRECNMG